jgi:hypothetical protein
MDCETARRRLEEGEPDETLTVHLETCAVCAGEAAFDRRLATAVAAMPQERAPEALLTRVMAAVEADASPAAASRSAQLSLRPWELGGVSVLCLLLLTSIPLALSHGLLPQGFAASRNAFLGWGTQKWSSVSADAGALWRDAGNALDTAWRDFGGDLLVGSGAWVSWMCGVAAFAVAFYLLLTWHPAEPAEDAHA